MRGKGRWLMGKKVWKNNYFILVSLEIGNSENYIVGGCARKPVASEITDVW